MNRDALMTSLRRILGVGLVLLAIAMIIAAVEQKESSLTNTLAIRIEPLAGGHTLLDEADVRQILDRSFGFDLEGTPLASIDMERVERVLEEESFVAEANAFIDANNHIKITIRQRQPVLRVMDANGLNYYLDRHGTRMPLSGHYTAHVLVATGHLPPHVPDFRERPRYGLNQVFELAALIREDPLFDPLIEQLHVRPNGELVLIPKVGEQQILLGRAVELADKMENLKIFYLEALPYEGWTTYETIDCRYEGQVVAKKS